MQAKLKLAVKKYGILSISILFGFKDTQAIAKWMSRGIPHYHLPRLKYYLDMPEDVLKSVILEEHARRLGL